MFSFVYNSALYLLALAAMPRLLYLRLFKGKYHHSLPQKFGWQFPEINKGGRPLIWLHATSVGETRAAAPFANKLKDNFNNAIVVISSTTETGHNEAIKAIPDADYHVYLPLDFSWIIKPIIRRVVPDLVIITESDFWYNFLRAAKECGAVTVLINGKVSIRSMQRYIFFSLFTKRLFGLFDLMCVQSKEYLQRFTEMGIDPGHLFVSGNLKFDDSFPMFDSEGLAALRREIGIKPTDQVIVIGSTHSPEEEQILSVLKPILEQLPDLKILLVPRHPERFNEVDSIIKKLDIGSCRYSLVSVVNSQVENRKIILVDVMGLLRQCYQIADIAIVAGSFTPKVGGHNIVEPCWYGVPSLFGPYMGAQPELLSLVLSYGAGLQLTLAQLPEVVLRLLGDRTERKRLGEAGKRLASDNQGATEKTITAITLKLGQLQKNVI